jgi:hypothetical protein
MKNVLLLWPILDHHWGTLSRSSALVTQNISNFSVSSLLYSLKNCWGVQLNGRAWDLHVQGPGFNHPRSFCLCGLYLSLCSILEIQSKKLFKMLLIHLKLTLREDVRKGWRRLNVVEILCTHAWKWKNETCWNYSKNGGEGIKENDGGVEFNCDIL